MKKIIELILTISATSVLLSIGLNCIFNNQISLVKNKFQDEFERIIWIEMEKRIEDSGIPISFSSLPAQKSDILKINNKGEIKALEKDSTYNEQTVIQRRKQALQTSLKEIKLPVQIITLDSLYTNILKRENPLIEACVRYIDNENGNIVDSKPASKVYAAYHTPIIQLGLKKEMSIQGFYTLPFSYILWETRIPVVFSVGVWLLITGGLIFLLIYYRKKKEKSIVYLPVKEMEKVEEKDILLKISDAIYFHPQKAEIHYNRKNIITLSGQLALLFQAFIEAPGNFISYEQIDNILGWEKMDKTTNRRGQVINRLKDTLKSIPEMAIENYNKKGYRLVIVENEVSKKSEENISSGVKIEGND